MKALAFAIAITVLFTSQSFAQTYCNITEEEARVRDSRTRRILKARFKVGGQPKHWEDQEALFGMFRHGKEMTISLSGLTHFRL